MDELLLLSAAEIVRRIRAGALNPVDAVEAHIRRIQQVNPRLNAVVTPLFDDARAEAQAAADRIAAQGTDDLPPLFGLPVTIKDCWPVAGVRFTGGSWYHRDDIAAADAPLVQRLRQAGAIILGKTNLPDMCWAGESVNLVFGRTHNARSRRHTAGGSSGGEGAIVAAGGSPLGLGSDIAGSVRIPAAMNGCVGLKPTAGRITTAGHLPDVPAFFDGWNTAGPLARRVEDLALALRVLSETPVRPVESLSLKGRRLIVYPRAPILPIHPRVADTVAMAAGALAAAGMAVSRTPRPPLLEAGFSYLALLEREGGGQAFTTALGGGQPYRLWDEIRANVQGRGRISGAALTHNTLTRAMGGVLSAVGFGSAARLERLRAAFRAALGEGGLLLCPLLPTPPAWHGWTYWYGLLPPYTFMFNALGVPAVVLPVGWTANGLPLAVQIVAQAGDDEVALAAAAELERVFGGWRLAG